MEISRHVRYLWRIRWMDYGLLYASIQLLLQSAVDLVFAGPNIVQFAFAGFAAWFVHVGLRNVGTVASRQWKAYVIAIGAALAICLVIGGLGLLAEGPGGPVSAIFGFFGAAWAAVTLYSVARVRRLPIAGVGVNLAELGRTMADDGRESSAAIDLSQVKRVDSALGITCGVLGVLILVGSAVGYHFASEQARNVSDVQHQIQLFNAFDCVGFFLLLRMRRYFQIDADALLRVDRRQPILFLRSFQDDEKLNYSASDKALFDYSLEARLSRHFTHFGPFVAVGSPGEALPVPGAARARMSDADWQENVRRWMRESQIILMYCGSTYSVNWELATLARKGYLSKAIVLFPPRRGWVRRSRKVPDDLKLRLARVQSAVHETSWAVAASALESANDIRALVFNADATLTVVHSRREDREAFHLAVLVCHYLLGQQPAPAALRLRAVADPRRRSWPLAGAIIGIGASPDNTVSIDGDEYVSAEHARIERSGNELTIVDLHSRNGTFVNEVPLRGAARAVHPGDRIRVGHSLFELAAD